MSGFGGKDMNRGGEEIDTILPCSEGRNYTKMGGGGKGGNGGEGGFANRSRLPLRDFVHFYL